MKPISRRQVRIPWPLVYRILAVIIVAVTGVVASGQEMEELPMRRLVFCLDGTWNNAERGKVVEGDRKRFKPTNVLKTCRAVVPVAPDGTSQIAYYHEGVGAFIGEPSRLFRLQKLTDRIFGGAYGGGFEGGVKSAYRFLVTNYRQGDEIYVFGFSRGAAQARSFVRFIDWVGGALHKEDEYYIPELFSVFRKSRAEPGRAAQVLAAIRARRGDDGDPDAVRDPRPVTVRFLGVYDTVLSLGLRFKADRSEGEVHSVAPRYAFHLGLNPPPIVEVVRQASAIDETRWDYRVHSWEKPSAPGQSLVQRWFPGVHTQVGGSREKGGLENGALQWMVDEAEAAGLVLDGEYLSHFGPWRRHEAVGQASRLFRIIETLRGKRGRGVRTLDAGPEAGITIDPSALLLLIEVDDYRPKNLLAYLSAHPEALKALEDPEDREAVKRILAEARDK